MNAMNTQNMDFAARIARIEAGENSFKSMIFVGNDETYRAEDLRRVTRKKGRQVAKRVVATAKPKSAKQKSRLSVLAMPLAFIIGATACVLWQFADFQMNGLSSLFAESTRQIAVNLATGMIVAILLCQAFALSAPQHVLASFVGLAVMTFGLPHLVNYAPEQFAQYFSTAWVGTILAQSAPLPLPLG